jgi:lysyl-tRNA synthetase class 1
VVRFFYFRTKAGKHKDFDINKNLKQLVETYEHVERLHFGAEPPSPQEDMETLKRSYALSQMVTPPAKYFQIPYGHLITIYQIVGNDWERAKTILSRQGQLAGMAEAGAEPRTRHKYECAGRWLERFAPPEDRFVLVKEHSQAPELAKALTPEQRAFIKALSERMGTVEWTAAKIHDTIHETTLASGLKAAQGFEALYTILVNNRKGPRLGFFLASLDREWVLERLRIASGEDG